MPQSKQLRVALAASIALFLVIFGAFVFAMPRGARAPDFTLDDQNGQPFRLSDHRGHVVALFFGYTHCPDVCPTTLAALARAKRKLTAGAKPLDVVFVTVDPARDTTAVVRRYVRLFDPSFIGLTGTEAQLAPVYAAYHIYHQQLPHTPRNANYTVAHSSTIVFIGSDGDLHGRGDWSDTPDELATKVARAE
jgi:protein SCO1/2